MKFKEFYLTEKFKTGIHTNGKYVEIYETPTPSEIKDIMKDENNAIHSVRGGFDEETVLSCWNGDILHGWVEKQLKTTFYLKFDFYPDHKHKFSLSVLSSEDYIKKLDQDTVLASLRDAFPLYKEDAERFVSEIFVNKLDENEVTDIEDVEGIDKDALSSLIKYMIDVKKMNIEPLPKIRVIDNDKENAEKLLGDTGNYDPMKKIITVYTMDRHPEDVLRSFAHEAIHHSQNIEGRLKNISTQNVNKDKDLKALEAEANLKGNMTFRAWKDSIKETE